MELLVVSWQAMAHETRCSPPFFVIHDAVTRHAILKRDSYTSTMDVPSRYQRQDRVLTVLIHSLLYSNFRSKANDLLRLCVRSDHIGLVYAPPYLDNSLHNACNAFFVNLRLR